MLGLDSRSAMIPGGATDGFGNLAAALLIAPRMKRQQEQADADKADERAYRNQQLQDAIQGRTSAAAYQQQKLKQEREIADQQNATELERIHAAVNGHAQPAREGADDTIVPDGMWDRLTTTLVPVTKLGLDGQPITTYEKAPLPPDQARANVEAAGIDWNRRRFGYKPPPRPMGPPPPSAPVAPRRFKPGEAPADDPESDMGDTPSTPGAPLTGFDQNGVEIRNAGPPAPSGKAVRTSVIRKMVGPGKDFPDMKTALDAAAAQGHVVIQDG